MKSFAILIALLVTALPAVAGGDGDCRGRSCNGSDSGTTIAAAFAGAESTAKAGAYTGDVTQHVGPTSVVTGDTVINFPEGIFEGVGSQMAPTLTSNPSLTASPTATGGAGGQGGAGGSVGPISVGEGDSSTSFTTENNSHFFSMNRSLPMANGCWGSYDGGANGSNNSKSFGAFFGLQVLNLDCFFDNKAEGEMNADIRARYECASKATRNAISYEYIHGLKKVSNGKGGERKANRGEIQQHCVNYLREQFIAQIEWEMKTTLAAIDAGKTIVREDPEAGKL